VAPVDDPSKPTACPYPFHSPAGKIDPLLSMPDEYRRRREEFPVALIDFPGVGDAYLLVRYSDVQEALRDTTTYSRRAAEKRAYPGFPDLTSSILGNDGEEHRRIKDAAHEAFRPSRVENLRPGIRAHCTKLLDDIEAQGPPADLVPAYGTKLALDTIADVVGVPPGERSQFTSWGHAFLDTAPESAELRTAAHAEMSEYIRRLVNHRRHTHEGDLLSDIVHDGKALSAEEIINLAIAMLVAGWETTAAFIEWAIWYLLTQPELFSYLRSHPDRLPTATEELLRLHRPGPGDGLPRVTTRDVTTKSGVTIPAGSPIFFSVISGNYDELVYPDAETANLDRFAAGGAPKHLTFGWGPHVCLGANLARVEAQEAIGGIISRFPSLHLVEPSDVAGIRHAGPSVWGLQKLLVAW
jgi:cytochrome P450